MRTRCARHVVRCGARLSSRSIRGVVSRVSTCPSASTSEEGPRCGPGPRADSIGGALEVMARPAGGALVPGLGSPPPIMDGGLRAGLGDELDDGLRGDLG